LPRDDAHLLDILKAARLAIEFKGPAEKAEFLEDAKTQSAVLHQLLIIGEAVKRISPEFRAAHLEVPWKLTAPFRTKVRDDPARVPARGPGKRAPPVAGNRARTSEILLHLEIYKEVPAAKGVVHCHPAHATAYAITGRVPPTCVIPEYDVFIGKVAVSPYETPGTRKFAETVIPYVKNHNTVLLANHGIICWADTVTHAEWFAEVVPRVLPPYFTHPTPRPPVQKGTETWEASILPVPTGPGSFPPRPEGD
jgi:uncharacterized protein with HEPN domain